MQHTSERNTLSQELRVTGLAESGAGLAEIEFRGKPLRVFVPDAVPGDLIEAEITLPARGAHSASASVTRIISPSPDKRTPSCAAAGLCGGCPASSISPEAQLALKRRFLNGLFEKAGFGDLEIDPVKAMPETASSRYRNKSVLRFGTDRKGNTVLGMFGAGSHRLIPEASRCPQCPVWMEKAAEAALTEARNHLIPAWDETSGSGTLRSVLMREGAEGRLFTLVAAERPNETFLRALSDALKASGITTAVLSIRTKPGNAVLGETSETLFGSGSVTAEIGGMRFSVKPETFLQVNSAQTLPLYETAISAAGIQPDDTVLDLYCGIGTITLLAAKHASRVIGVEIVPQSIEEAQKNARFNGVRNAEFHCGAAETVLPKLYDSGIRPRVIIADPPRKGLDAAIPQVIAAMAPETLVYIACGPEALARDAARFEKLGYGLLRVTPVDLFPDTLHVECVAVFEKKF